MSHSLYRCASILSLERGAVSQLLRLQGKFTDIKIPLTDTLPVRFSIWDTEDGYGNLLWEEVQNVPIKDSTFQIVLGRTKPLTPSVFSGGDRWVELQLGNDAPMRPRHWIPNKIIQEQVVADQAAQTAPEMTDQERRALELQIEKYKEPVREAAPPPARAPTPIPAYIPAVIPTSTPNPKPASKPKPKPVAQTSEGSGEQGPVYQVQNGDTLKSIAQKLYGNAELWYDLYYLNRDRLGPMGHLFTGQILVLPTQKPGVRNP